MREAARDLYAAGWTFEQRKVRCGRKSCHCLKGKLHGPYWYAYRKAGKRVRSRYLGRELPKDLAALLKLDQAMNPRKKRPLQARGRTKEVMAIPRH